MRAVLLVGVFALAFVTTAGLSGQDPKPKDGKDAKDKGKEAKVEPKSKGTLPTYWAQIGLTADQKDKVYKLNDKYKDEIDKLESQVKELKAKLSKERLDLLTADQKKALEEILKKKAGGQ